MNNTIMHRRYVQLSVFLAGFTAMSVQILAVREFLIVFYGNELSIGIVLASWLLWGALGSCVSAALSRKTGSGVRSLAICHLMVSIALPAIFLGIRSIRSIAGVLPGELLGFWSMLWTSVVMLGPICFFMGFMFSQGVRAYTLFKGSAERGMIEVYVAEAAGALAGGVLTSSFFVICLPVFRILAAMASLNMIMGGILLYSANRKGPTKHFIVTVFAVLAAFTLILSQPAGTYLERVSRDILWKGFNTLDSRNSIYGNITVTAMSGQTSFFENGLHLYTVPDELSSEETAHFPMLELDSWDDILLVGGGCGGVLGELLKYPVKRVDYVELDPLVIRMAERYLPGDRSMQDSRVNIINMDGRAFLRKFPGPYDSVIINLGDPLSLQLNRFYTVDFFRMVARVMKKNAVLSLSLTSSENYISDDLAGYLGSIYGSMERVFPECMMIPGDTIHFLASTGKGVLSSDPARMSERLVRMGIKTGFVRDYYLDAKMSPERVEYAEERVKGAVSRGDNRDFRPFTVYLAIMFWNSQSEASFVRRVQSVLTSGVILGTSGLGILCLMFPCFFTRGRQKAVYAVRAAVFATGFSEILFQLCVLMSFQCIYGYVFYKISIIFTSFMLGTALGGWFSARSIDNDSSAWRSFVKAQIGICLYPLIVPMVFTVFSLTRSASVSWLGSDIIYPIMPFIAGFIGGVQFPLSVKLCSCNGGSEGYIVPDGRTGKGAGINYGLDLGGSAIGALVGASIMIPIIGVYRSCAIVFFINLVVLVMLLSARRGIHSPG
ncbi:MAG: hypothetical protein PHH49_07580 [Candidatus Omnitrophica bacterium]|nr:hypothetical protein [Candidatus Omnitrophota bacterium]